ncbi:metallophosphatase domain-containing protein [Aspergillus novofumigatus IBT 16806]|uniref:Metallo-dependent phosphatase n=1 Tax=Aspergillus novofumigatus (strain IBT 16806) TaxID=1392255 RepID=A0A2I1CPT2_ASPN1|nr:Metallo-dependent phosphatase [Aspergillus novofumigatus IBT 16806]PKX99619.1 Metallo-dependent phosphatase [Aspergillus novofumigatus IBT 16806]
MAFSTSGLDALLRRPEQESIWSRLRRAPMPVLAELVYTRFAQTRTPTDHDGPTIRVVCISDTHNTEPQLPDGDLLIHAGDFTQSGTQAELEAQIEWLDRQPHRFKVAIAGNHELCLDPKAQVRAQTPGRNEPVDWKSIRYLENSSTIIDFGCRRVKVFGSPYTARHGNWAFQYPRNENIWDLGRYGCIFLRDWLWSAKRKPLLHVFGHVHGAYGKETLCWDDLQRAYESIMDNEAQWMSLIMLLWHALLLLIRPRDPCQRTVMVNAAAIGGLRDEKRRDAICVDI